MSVFNTTPTRGRKPLLESYQFLKDGHLGDLSIKKQLKDTLDEKIKKEDESSHSVDKSKEINKTYILPGSKTSSQTVDIYSKGRLMLQRKKTDNKDTEIGEKKPKQNTVKEDGAPEKRLTLQRRTRTGLITEKNKVATENTTQQKQDGATNLDSYKWLTETNNSDKTPKATTIQRSGSLRDTTLKSTPKTRSNPSILVKAASKGNENSSRSVPKSLAESVLNKGDTPKTEAPNKLHVFLAPAKRTPAEKNVKEVFEKTAGRDITKPLSTKYGSLERQKAPGQVSCESVKPVPKASTLPGNSRLAVGAVSRNWASTVQASQPRKTINLVSHSADVKSSGWGTPVKGFLPKQESTRESVIQGQDCLKMENSAVTVAVRVRPFNNREKTETAHQVIFMENQEIVVQHPDSKQNYSFIYDFSFFSFDKTDPNFASQQTVYEKLALPLLERAFEGYNTCLFAYGQTGSGKSYTMMGFSDEAGVIPRFCEELFSRVGKSENQQVTYLLEMSYFEVYNEKIHDLLVVKDEQSQKKLPLRVREHPVFGPYVADLSTNVVSSYDDIKSWLELGNKQRATAATGMNDKSSRSHSVFTLVMTQTKTEFVEEEEHDHTITSRINLVDLAGSERCSTAQTSGDRLREGVSINKSLLTLGKVISALSEHSQSKKKVFIPYRESVLTWLLKESLGGNSKTAMIATVSPAASNVEETLSTLRYANQARMIINVAKVNEDTSAKLIRELKAEVEKLKAAQMSSQGVETEKMRLFKQEITTLKMQLTQQEKDMAEAHRTWKKKLEQAEKRKREEAKELQKAGIALKVDNRLPNLVNLNEDPQLSEMLLYMIKEGQTKVGKQKSDSTHDIQLSGALIADDHCIISNVGGTVSIAPIKDAKTFVNGNLVSESTVLHHGDRVILGGDHYFRFNHPGEVQRGTRVSCWNGAGDGHKDFEFAKNELLAAQRAQLEAEIEEARMKAKEEMIQGIQVAKEMAQKELSDQKALYEYKIKALENELKAECERKKLQELNNRKVATKIEELQSAKLQLEQEVQQNKKRLLMEAQATRQALADHAIHHAKIIEALEEEKKKISEDLVRTQQKRARNEHYAAGHVQPQWDSMKLSLMIQEANAISRKLKKHAVFSRHESSDKDRGKENEQLQVQVQNTKLGITTFWSLEKLESNLAAMREMEQGDSGAKDDVFYDPNDEWEPDIANTSAASSFSRRKSRSLLKSRRISGRLYEIRVHPIQSLHNSQYSGLMNKTTTVHPSISESALPGICKELIGSAVAQMKICDEIQESMADRIMADILTIHNGVAVISTLYEQLDDDSQENLLVCNGKAQCQLVKATSALERVIFLTTQWLYTIKPSGRSEVNEELKLEIKKMGGYFQLLIQGCDSDISSMVTEAQDKISLCLNTAIKLISHLSIVTGTELHITEEIQKSSLAVSFYEGGRKGISTLLDNGMYQAKEMQRTVQLIFPGSQILQELQKNALDLATSLQVYISHCKLEGHQSSGVGYEDSVPDHFQLKEIKRTATDLIKFNDTLKEISSIISSTLKGEEHFSGLHTFRDAVCLSSKFISDYLSAFFKHQINNPTDELHVECTESIVTAKANVDSALNSITATFDQLCVGITELPSAEDNVEKNEDKKLKGNEHSVFSIKSERKKGVPKFVYTLSTRTNCSPSAIQWV
ncbi:kinesin-like protein KIF14 [Lepisosteus oculatus]|uniref:kinesin-like protein KIF14 n=1 Tax=Lepisosteus oculatus TaxID=7918 RepID=UPI00371CD6DC